MLLKPAFLGQTRQSKIIENVQMTRWFKTTPIATEYLMAKTISIWS